MTDNTTPEIDQDDTAVINHAALTTQEKFALTRKEINDKLIDRDDEVVLIMAAMLCNEHVLLIGPPGVAKSLLADTICDWIDGHKFAWLMNKHTDPGEILGPVDIEGLKKGDYRRITTGKLPEAEVAFLDEPFKSSSACLNVMLKILNERRFNNGRTEVACPLRIAIGASNEYPTEAKELGAFFDRFLFRKNVEPVGTDADIHRLMFEPDLTPRPSTTLTISELTAAQVDIRGMEWEAEAVEAVHEIRRQITSNGILIGDRRIRKSTMAIQSFAWLNGNDKVSTDDLEILAHMWWVSPEGQPEIVANTVMEVAAPCGLVATQLYVEAREICGKVPADDLEKASTAAAKMSKVAKKLAKIEGVRAADALSRVKEMIKDLRLRTIESV